MLLQGFYRDHGLVQGDPFIIRMKTCDFPSEPVSYPVGHAPDMLTARDIRKTSWPGFFPDLRHGSGGYILEAIDDATQGLHSGSMNFSNVQALTDVAIVDGAGFTHWVPAEDISPAGVSVTYELDVDREDLFLAAGATSSISISADFTATSPGAVRATSTANAGTPMARGVRAIGMGYVIVSVLAYAIWNLQSLLKLHSSSKK